MPPNHTSASHHHYHLPAVLWERILLFLPDEESVATACRVCRAWHDEIWPHWNLWRRLLERRQWPVAAIAAGEERCEFQKHFSVYHRVRSVISQLTTMRSSGADENDAGFSSSHVNGQPCFSADGLHVWSPQHVLVVSSQICLLRLLCRHGDEEEVLRRRVYTSSSEHACIMSVDLDEEYLACLVHVSRDMIDSKEEADDDVHWLLIWSREDFQTNKEPVQFVLDTPAMRDFLSKDELPTAKLVEEVNVVVGGLTSCGKGRFLVELAIGLNATDTTTSEEDDTIVQSRKLVMCSAAAGGGILWVGDSCPTANVLLPYEQEMMLSSDKKETAHSFVLVASRDFVYRAPASSQEDRIILEEGSVVNLVFPNPPDDGANWNAPECQKVALLNRHAVVAFRIISAAAEEEENTDVREKLLLSFYRFPQQQHTRENVESTQTLELEEGIQDVLQILFLGPEHVMVVCRCRPFGGSSVVAPTNSGGGGGHWLRNEGIPMGITVRVFHLENYCEIGCFPVKNATTRFSPLFATQADSTLALAFGGRIAMSSSV